MKQDYSLHREDEKNTVIKMDEITNLEQFITVASMENEEDTTIQKTCEYCLITKNEVDWRIGMHFLYTNGFYEETQFLIDKNKKSKNQINHKWAAVYELVLARRFRSIPHHEILKKLQKFKTEDTNLQFIIKQTLLSTNFDMFDYGSFNALLEELQGLLLKLDNHVLISLAHINLDQLFFVYYWKSNEVILARKYGFRLLNKMYNKKQKAHLHVNLSLTYIFDDFNACMYHLNQARLMAEEFQDNRLLNMIRNQNYPFICAHFQQTDNVASPNNSEQAHLEIARGNLIKAQGLLEPVTQVTPFIKYYLGLAHQDRKLLISSYNDFIEKRSDYFFARLPLHALQNL
ncbi:AimR family lysis-lysogeny pheromone receptor [Paraliobacillus sediminis]|uniref:AimR family lysis-lysogeny pheromone receptor n=1 Tax=Paraliobacillus sediminis TaxID=1885916 RepID=UPI000E3E5F14|nr:AimR family lysis-lysogeny pheromone receptor [Paraliobacillus sediminis]